MSIWVYVDEVLANELIAAGKARPADTVNVSVEPAPISRANAKEWGERIGRGLREAMERRNRMQRLVERGVVGKESTADLSDQQQAPEESAMERCKAKFASPVFTGEPRFLDPPLQFISVEMEKAKGAACPSCGQQASDYSADRWACSHCGWSGPLKGVEGYIQIPITNSVQGVPGTVVWSADLLSDTHGRSPQACDACTNEGGCQRIGQCLRYKCQFGQVEKP